VEEFGLEEELGLEEGGQEHKRNEDVLSPNTRKATDQWAMNSNQVPKWMRPTKVEQTTFPFLRRVLQPA